MYLAIVALTMFVLPIASVGVGHQMRPDEPTLLLVGRWFVSWAVGVRLGLAGLRQPLQPAFTAREILQTQGDEALPVVRELGVANLAAGVLGVASLVAPTFVPRDAIWAGVFYAGGWHHACRRTGPLTQRDRGDGEGPFHRARVGDLRDRHDPPRLNLGGSEGPPRAVGASVHR